MSGMQFLLTVRILTSILNSAGPTLPKDSASRGAEFTNHEVLWSAHPIGFLHANGAAKLEPGSSGHRSISMLAPHVEQSYDE